LGLRPRPRWELTALLRPPFWIYGNLLLRGGNERKGKKDEKGGEGKGRDWAPFLKS